MTCPDLMSCSCRARARSRMSLIEIGWDADRVAEPLSQIEYKAARGLGRGGERVLGALALLVGNLPLLNGKFPLPIRQPGKHERNHETRRRLPVSMLRRLVAPRRLSATKAWVSVVGSGAPRGREAIQRSASSSTGERSNSPLFRPSAAQRRAASPYSVCCRTQPMSVLSASASRSALASKCSASSKKMKFRRRNASAPRRHRCAGRRLAQSAC